MRRQRKKKQATVYILAGPNGAGKTTFASQFLPDFVKCREFLNADLIATGLSPFAPETQNVRAGRLLLERIEELAAAGRDFGFETTLSGRAYVKRIARMKGQGYQIALIFLWLPSADMAIARVASRVRRGGHSVPEQDVRRRFAAGQRNFLGPYRPLLDSWWLYDATRLPPKLIAHEQAGTLVLAQPRLFQRIRRDAGA
ncbi:MAG TPA: AAA family ATPase [Gemmataceae bacterium]|nr:AAA family ATPase [Gemmataceae bacterium]